jgi:hypothetical protein
MLPAGDKPKRVHVFPLAKALVLVGKLIPELQDATRFVEADAEGTVKVRCPCMAAYPKRDWFTLRQKCHIAEHARSRQHVECAYPFSPRAVAPRLLLLCWTILAAVFPALRALCSRLCALCVHRPALPPTAATASCCAGLDEDHTIKHRDKRSRANASTVGAGGAGGGGALGLLAPAPAPAPAPAGPAPVPAPAPASSFALVVPSQGHVLLAEDGDGGVAGGAGGSVPGGGSGSSEAPAVPPESAAVAVSIENAAAVASWLSLDEFGSTKLFDNA